ncbi:M24 family metallopeptidase [Massiliimalia massiliensis]|uniref:M24 family metallopeptidase n=1 Tax=Massiliimalia massiliensis TaxID=1852384 RepID=UPI000986843C|nr:M24 family metallopeptidase [Massiliimalia massiliensis]
MLEQIKKALECNVRAYETIKGFVRAGVTELDVLKAIEAAYREQAGEPLHYIYDLVSGKRSAEISGPATEKVIETGDCLIADLLPQYQGRWCDTTRTFFVGEPEKELREAYAALLEALRCGEACLKPGVAGEEIFREVDSCLRSKGYQGLVHHAGHAVGLTEMDDPDFVLGCDQSISEGMVVTLEPGIYLENNGIRIENNYLITADGAQNLFPYPEEMEYFIIGGKKK